MSKQKRIEILLEILEYLKEEINEYNTILIEDILNLNFYKKTNITSLVEFIYIELIKSVILF
jgi:hypothetical protein